MHHEKEWYEYLVNYDFFRGCLEPEGLVVGFLKIRFSTKVKASGLRDVMMMMMMMDPFLDGQHTRQTTAHEKKKTDTARRGAGWFDTIQYLNPLYFDTGPEPRAPKGRD
jgi:hypothetical protein